MQIAVRMSDFLDILMSGAFCRREEVGSENGQIALACSVEQWVEECDGYGVLRTKYGQRCTRNIKSAGSMLTLAKRFGIIRLYILKVCRRTHMLLILEMGNANQVPRQGGALG